MPVIKTGKKYSVNNKEYDTEDKANEAYMAYLDVALGVPKEDTKDKKTKKKVIKSDDTEETDDV